MALVRFHKNPLKVSPEVKTYTGDLLDCIMQVDWCRNGIVVVLNGEHIADTVKLSPNEAVTALTIDVGINDAVDVYARPLGTGLEWYIIAAIVVGAGVVAYALMPAPKAPADQGVNDSSQNNQLNAARNSFRPDQAIPDIAGQIIAFPDFIQRSSYIYVNNRRRFTEVLCFGVGYYDVTDVKDGQTKFDDTDDSTYEIYQPNQTVPAEVLNDVRTADGSEDFPLPATDDNARSATITNGSFVGSGTLDLGDGGASIIEDLGLAAGQSFSLNVWYEFEGSSTQYSGSFGISSIAGTVLTITPAVLPPEDGGTVYGSFIQTSGGVPLRWFTLSGDAIETIRAHIKMPQGIRKGDGTIGNVNYLIEYQELDSAGNPIGSISGVAGVFSGNTLQPQFITRDISVTASRYRARVTRTSASLGDNAIDLLVLESLESVTPYSGANFGNVTIGVFKRVTSSQQARGGSDKISAQVTRRLELFNPTTGLFATGTFTATRSAFQYVMYLLNSRGKVNTSLINYEELFDIEDSLTVAKLGYFDFSNDSFNVSLRERVTAALNVARCYHYMQGAIWRFGRDEAKPVRSFVINRRNLIPQTYAMNETMFVTNDFDSVEIKYVDPATNSDAYSRYRIGSGGAIEAGIGIRLKRLNLAGCRSVEQAENRANLEIRKLKYLRRSVQCQTLPDIMAVEIGSRGGVVNPAATVFDAGEVLAIDGTTVTLSEPIAYSGFIYFVSNTGAVSNPVAFTRLTDYTITVPDATALYVADGYEVQLGSKYVACSENDFTYGDYLLTKRSRPDQNFRVTCELAQYDERVFEFDIIPPEPDELLLSSTGGSASVLNESCVTVSPTATVTPTGGTGSYAYTWSKLSGSGAIASGGATATVTVDFTSVCPEDTFTGSYRCTVASGAQTKFIDVLFTATNTAVDPTPEPLAATAFGGSNAVYNPSCVVVSVSASVTATGGSGSYTYSWSKISGDGTIGSGGSTDTMTVLMPSVCPEQVKVGVYRCAVSDGTDTVNVDVTYTGENFHPAG